MDWEVANKKQLDLEQDIKD
jgi:hypothetical protein